MKHTPGPWKPDPSLPKVILADDGETLAQTYFVYGDKARDTSQAEANARLIAAAPELLELCKYLRNYARLADLGNDTIARLDATIAKAEGTA